MQHKCPRFIGTLDEETRAFLCIFNITINQRNGSAHFFPTMRIDGREYVMYLLPPEQCPYPNTSIEYWREMVRRARMMYRPVQA